MPAACPALVLFKDYFCAYTLVQGHPLENLATSSGSTHKDFPGGSGVLWTSYLITFLVSIKRRKPIKLIKADTAQGGLNTWHASRIRINHLGVQVWARYVITKHAWHLLSLGLTGTA